MKKIIVLLFVAAIFTACSNEKKWEYKELVVEGYSYEFAGEQSKMYSRMFGSNESKLNQMGQQGWELVSSYPIIETVHPNFGDKRYVTGLQPNTRTSKIVFIFKREYKGDKEKQKNKALQAPSETEFADTVAVDTVEGDFNF